MNRLKKPLFLMTAATGGGEGADRPALRALGVPACARAGSASVVPAGSAAHAAAPRARLKTVPASILAFAIVGAVPFAIGAFAVAKRLAYDSGIAAQAKVLEVERAWLRDLVYPVPRRAIYRVAYEFRTAAGVPMRGEGTYVQSRALVPLAAAILVQLL